MSNYHSHSGGAARLEYATVCSAQSKKAIRNMSGGIIQYRVSIILDHGAIRAPKQL